MRDIFYYVVCEIGRMIYYQYIVYHKFFKSISADFHIFQKVVILFGHFAIIIQMFTKVF